MYFDKAWRTQNLSPPGAVGRGEDPVRVDERAAAELRAEDVGARAQAQRHLTG